MKVINVAIILAVASMVIGCGGNANKDVSKESTTEQVADSNKVAAGNYANEKLGYSITYPKDILILDEATVNGDEQIFKPTSGKAVLRIFLDKRVDKSGTPITLNAAYDQDIANKKGRQVAYSSFKTNYYVISGLEENELYYQKTIFTKGALVTAVLKYTKEEKETFSPILNTLFNSFN